RPGSFATSPLPRAGRPILGRNVTGEGQDERPGQLRCWIGQALGSANDDPSRAGGRHVDRRVPRSRRHEQAQARQPLEKGLSERRPLAARVPYRLAVVAEWSRVALAWKIAASLSRIAARASS